MARDADAKLNKKWADTGDRATPESLGLDRGVGYGVTYSQTSGDRPEREGINQLLCELSAQHVEVNQQGGILDWDADLDYILHARVMGSDGEIYRAVVASGPGTSNATNPTTDTSDAVWTRDIPDAAEAASETVAGLVELADNAEALAGTDTQRAVTPAGMQSHGDNRYALGGSAGAASTTQAGIIEIADNAEALAGTDTQRSLTPAGAQRHGDTRYALRTLPAWSNSADYAVGDSVRGSDSGTYQSVVVTGPATGNVQDPVGRPDDNIWVQLAATSVPDATTTARGIVELSTTSEGQAGTDDQRAVTPLVLDAVLDTRFNNLVGTAPGLLNTLGELSDALGDDPNFATTVTNILNGKAGLDSPAFTGRPTGTSPALSDDSGHLATTQWIKDLTATTSRTGVVELATATEAETGTDANRAITPATFRSAANDRYSLKSHGHSYASTGHSHSTYSRTSHGHSYASTGHSHSAYSLTSHGHSGFATDSELSSGLGGKSDTGHSHSAYSLTGHGHSGFASSGHGHSGYVTGVSISTTSGSFSTPTSIAGDRNAITSVSITVTKV